MPLRLAFTLELIALRGGPEWFTEVLQVMHQNIYFQQNHNLMSFAQIDMVLVLLDSGLFLLLPYGLII